jgi:hypothetical protein
LGGIAAKPGVVDGRIAPRDYLCMTLRFDHDLIDGAPAARFVSRLRELIEGAYGLGQEDVERPTGSTGAVASAAHPVYGPSPCSPIQ